MTTDNRQPHARAVVVPVEGAPVLRLIPVDLRSVADLVGGVVVPHYPTPWWLVYSQVAIHGEPPPVPNRSVMQLIGQLVPSWRIVLTGTAVLVGLGRQGIDVDAPAELIRLIPPGAAL